MEKTTSVMAGSLRSLTAANLSYNLLARLFVFILSSATAVILARHLSSNDYGIVGFGMIFMAFLWQLNDLGIASSLIQKESITELELYTGASIRLIFGLFLFSLSFVWGDLGQLAFKNPAVKYVIIVLSANLVIDGFGFIPRTILTRELQFKRLAIPQIGAQVVMTIVAVSTVYLGSRYWSIVLANVAASLASNLILVSMCPVPFKVRWDTKAAREHLKFGGHLLCAGLMTFVLYNADNFIIGAVDGAAILGFYAIAFNWSTKAPGFIGNAISNILLSTFSRVQNDKERLKRGYLSILEYISFAVVLANALLLVLSKEFLVLVLGAGTGKWLPAMLAMEVLCVYGVVRAILEPISNMIIAIGRPALISWSNAAVATFQLACLYPVLRLYGIAGVAALVTFSYTIQFLIYFPVLYRRMDLRFSAVFHSVLPAVLSGCALAGASFILDLFVKTSWLSLGIKLALGSGIYLLIYGLITKWKILQEAREIIGTALMKTTQSAV